MIDFFESLFGSKKLHALLVGHTYYAIAPAKDYPSCYRLTVRNNADFLIHQQAMQQVIPAPQTAPPNTEVWKLRDGAVEFKQLVNNWFTNTAVLYRGFNGSHFCWPQLIAQGSSCQRAMRTFPLSPWATIRARDGCPRSANSRMARMAWR